MPAIILNFPSLKTFVRHEADLFLRHDVPLFVQTGNPKDRLDSASFWLETFLLLIPALSFGLSCVLEMEPPPQKWARNGLGWVAFALNRFLPL